MASASSRVAPKSPPERDISLSPPEDGIDRRVGQPLGQRGPRSPSGRVDAFSSQSAGGRLPRVRRGYAR